MCIHQDIPDYSKVTVSQTVTTPQSNEYRKRMVFCANCGGLGHIYKTCNHLIISYGVICYKPYYDKATNSVYPQYLMVQRKDSLCYVEFIRGKYELYNKTYLMKLFSNMTRKERETIRECTDFNILWNSMWCRGGNTSNEHNTKNFNKEYKDAFEKFNLLLQGYNIIAVDTGKPIFIDLKYIIDNTTSNYEETEWGFPKGRRNINEDDINCAIREFKEETSISTKNFKINKDIKPLEEIFTGSNKIRYKHVYYVARYYNNRYENDDALYTSSNYSSTTLSNTPNIDPSNIQQNKEVKDVQWFSYQEAQDHIRSYNVERKELFKRLNNIVIKMFQYNR